MKTAAKDFDMLKAALLPATLLALVTAAVLLIAQGISTAVAMEKSDRQGPDIVDIAAGAEDFSTLVTALQAAGLVETLKGEGPFTVFAPTNAAFAKLDQDTLQGLLNDKDALTRVLTYHVVPGKVMAADVAGLDAAPTVQGQSIRIDTSDGVKVDDARVIETDIVASNGVIHVIDTVILPN